MKPISIRFCGFGGQGIVLSAVIMGTAVVTRRNLYAVQTQSYGSEARGGQCQAELIISEKPINSPLSGQMDMLVALSQSSLDRYLGSLRSGGILIYDPKLVVNVPNCEARLVQVPATEKAIELGNRIAANMVILGYLQESTGILNKDNLIEVARKMINPKYLNLNLRAIEAGISLARGVKLEV